MKDKEVQENNLQQEGTADKKAKKRAVGTMKDIIDFISTALIVFIVCNVVFMFHYIPSRSMEPTIKSNSFAICWRLPFAFGNPAPKYGDIVSFKNDEKGKILIKRVIGLPGDEIEFLDGYVLRNGELLDEPYVAEQGVTWPKENEHFTVPDGCFFVLGDNREHSSDSRVLDDPFIPYESIVAKMLVSFPIPAFAGK